MPYITQQEREAYDDTLNTLRLDLMVTTGIKGCGFSGKLNYIISTILYKIWLRNPRYETANALIGVLECAKLEFYRRVIANYEDEENRINGDVFTPPKGDQS